MGEEKLIAAVHLSSNADPIMPFLQDYATNKVLFGAFTTHYFILLSTDGDELSCCSENITPGARIVHVLKYPGRRKFYDVTPALEMFQRKVKAGFK